jgi:hypothetical protein
MFWFFVVIVVCIVGLGLTGKLKPKGRPPE